MGFFDLFTGGPYMAWAKDVPNFSRNTFRRAKYQVVPGPHGVPMMQLEFAFQRFARCVKNPHMNLVVIMDRSGSMGGTFRDGHVYNACAAILTHIARAGAGFDLIFYDTHVTDGGYVSDLNQLKNVIKANRPAGGGTVVTPALRHAVSHYKNKNAGLYMIVVTDGEFQDKQNVQDFVTQTLIPEMRPENPYSYRLHFVGAGEGADERFLRQIESLAAGQGVQLVTSHHHAHLSHSHNDMLDELDRAFLGMGSNFLVGEEHGVQILASGSSELARENVIMRVGDVPTNRWFDRNAAKFDFLPCHMQIGLEFRPLHPPLLPVRLEFCPPDTDQPFQMSFNVPLPKISTSGPSETKKSWTDFFLGGSPEEQAAREELKKRQRQLRQEEEARQATDLEALTHGDIPAKAKERLLELGGHSDEANKIFTSNLAPDEVALLRRHGYRARGMVCGSAMYHVGQAYAAKYDTEVRELSQAYDTATELAVNRMEKELQLIGAHGVIGVRLNVVRHEWSEHTIEVQAIGTAIEGPGPAPARPWLSDLSGQEWFALHRAGYEPVGLVWGHCAWFLFTSASDEMMHRAWNNVEMGHWSQGLSTARHKAMEDIMRRMKAVGGVGMIGVKINRRLDEVRLSGPGEDPAYEREHHNLLVSIIGTAIRPTDTPPKPVRQTVNMLSLRDGRIKPAVMMQEAALSVED